MQIHQSKYANILDQLIAGKAEKGSLKLWRSQKGRWYALISVSMEVPDALKTERWIGVDRGQKHLAVTSTPEGTPKFFSFARIKQTRRHFSKLRRRLQRAGKTSAVKKIERKERRTAQHINQIISKQIVNFAKRHQCGIRLEDLAGIRQTSKQYRQNKSDAAENRDYWPYYDLELKIKYKAQLAGIAVEKIPAAYTSQACCKCHWIGEREDQHFYCPHCQYQGHSDHNASRIQGSWTGCACLVVLQPSVSPLWAPATKADNAVMALSARPDAVYDDPPISVNAQRETATDAR